MKNVWTIPGFFLVIVLMSPESFPQKYQQGETETVHQLEKTRHVFKEEIQGFLMSDTWAERNIKQKYPKLARRFASIFPSATNERWIEQEDALFCYFTNKDRKAYAVFTTRGKMKYAVTYLEPTDLSAEALKKIRADYKGYSIFNVKEIMLYGYTMYRVILENDFEYIHIHVAGQEIEETEKLRKSLSR